MAKVPFRMPPVCFIVARSHGSNVIGCEGKLPWKLRSDLKRFRELTSKHAVIMGRKTFDSIGKPLSERFNVVVSRSEKNQTQDINLHGTETKLLHTKSAEDALFCSDVFTILNQIEEIFVIGGAEIYKRFSSIVDRVYLTEVKADVEGDAYFNEDFDGKVWRIVHRSEVKKDSHNEYDSDFYIFERRASAARLRSFADIAAKKKAHHVCMKKINDLDAKIIELYAIRHLQIHNGTQLDFRFG